MSGGSREERGERGSEKQNDSAMGNPSTLTHKINRIKGGKAIHLSGNNHNDKSQYKL